MKRLSKLSVALLAVALFVTLTSIAQAGGDYKGKVMSVNPEKLSFVLQGDQKGKVMPFNLDEDAAVYIDNQIRSIEDLQPGDHVSIVGRQEENSWIATVIRVERK